MKTVSNRKPTGKASAMVAAIVVVAAALSSPAHAYENACNHAGNVQDDTTAQYCQNIGHSAYNAYGPDRIRETNLGPIVGVTRIYDGDIIWQPETGPRVIRNSGLMYVIGPGGIANHVFYRWVTDIVSR